MTALVLQRQFAGGDSATVAWRERSAVLGRALYPPAAVLVLITGILLVVGGDAYSFADTFVSLGFLAFVVGLVLGVGVYAPQGRKALEELKAGNVSAALAIDRRIMAIGVAELILLVLTLLSMVYRWGS